MIVTIERLKEILEYFPQSGMFRWKISRSGVQVNAVPGSLDKDGYRRIRIDRKRYSAARLAWLYTYGRWPIAEIDHINGLRDDNRLENIREVSRHKNNQNLHKARKNSQTGLLGVSALKGRFIAKIQANGKRYYLGRFTTAGAAHEAYVAAKEALQCLTV